MSESILQQNYAVIANMTNDCGLSIVICSTDARESSFNVHMTNMNTPVASFNVPTYADALDKASEQLREDHAS
jgi:hypothetical protein